jgi:hypothetical protein
MGNKTNWIATGRTGEAEFTCYPDTELEAISRSLGEFEDMCIQHNE